MAVKWQGLGLIVRFFWKSINMYFGVQKTISFVRLQHRYILEGILLQKQMYCKVGLFKTIHMWTKTVHTKFKPLIIYESTFFTEHFYSLQSSSLWNLCCESIAGFQASAAKYMKITHTPVMFVRGNENFISTQFPLTHITGAWSISKAYASINSN